eukprot:366058-Chlamydomonas_euryale.AAC.8
MTHEPNFIVCDHTRKRPGHTIEEDECVQALKAARIDEPAARRDATCKGKHAAAALIPSLALQQA